MGITLNGQLGVTVQCHVTKEQKHATEHVPTPRLRSVASCARSKILVQMKKLSHATCQPALVRQTPQNRIGFINKNIYSNDDRLLVRSTIL